MLLIVFRIGSGAYALDASKVAEVLPLLEIDPLPDAPRGLAGVVNYRGMPVPVIELAALVTHGSARRLRSTRLLMLRDEDALHATPFALLVESATETLRVDPARLGAAARAGEGGWEGGRWFGPVMSHRGELVRIVDVPALLPEPLRAALGLQALGLQSAESA
jgi:chemotaxis-related protein WspB